MAETLRRCLPDRNPVRLTVLHMLSTNSLQAFSGVNATGPLRRTGPVDAQPRLVREQAAAQVQQAQPASKLNLPQVMPDRTLPRGSLLNLAV